MRHSPVVLYAAIGGFVCGIGTYTLWPVSLPTILYVALLALIAALVYRRSREQSLLLVTVFLFGAVIGLLRTDAEAEHLRTPALEAQSGRAVTIEGTVAREPDERESMTQLYVKTESALVLVRTEPYEQYHYGDRVSATGQLEQPEAFETEFGRVFDYAGYLKARGVTQVLSFADVKILSTTDNVLSIARLYDVKNLLSDSIERYIPAPEAALGLGLLLGEKRALGDELEEMFRRTGIIHIVVLSGYNVMLVVTFIMFLFSFFLPLRGRVVFGLVAIAAFAIIVGLSATVLRASLMAGLLLLAQATGRVYLVTRALFLAGVLMLLWQPYLLVYDIGFQLSFLATLGLILLAPAIEKRLSAVPRWFGARGFLTATIAAQIAVSPLLLYQIGQFSVLAVLVNVLVLPMVPLSMLLTFSTGLVGLVFPSAAAVLGLAAQLSLWYIITAAQYFGSLSFAAFVVPAFPFVLVPLGYLLVALAWYKLERTSLDPLAYWTIEEVEAQSETKTSVPQSETLAATPIFFR